MTMLVIEMVKDIRISIGFWDHWKTVKVKRLLGYEGIESLFRLWEFISQFHPKGILVGMDVDEIEIAAKWTGLPGMFVSTLANEKIRYLDIMGGVYSAHDWEEHQGFIFHAEERVKQAKKAIAKRYGAQSVNTDSNTDSNTDGTTPSPSPIPLPSPTPLPKHIQSACANGLPPHHTPERQLLNAKAIEILHHLNEAAGKKYGDTYPGIRHIVERLNEGANPEDMKKVIDKKNRHAEFNKNYMRPETLFTSENYSKYLAEDEKYYGKSADTSPAPEPTPYVRDPKLPPLFTCRQDLLDWANRKKG